MIVENDAGFAQLLLEVARESGFKGLIVSRGTDALTLVRDHKLDAITLDINLHDIDGWRVLARLKDDLNSRHIPVYIITTEEERERGLRMGAIGALTKPLKSKEALKEVFDRIKGFIEPHPRSLLVANSDPQQLERLMELVGGENVLLAGAATGQEALAKLKDQHFDAAILDVDMPDMAGLDLIEEIKKEPHLGDIPVILSVSRELS